MRGVIGTRHTRVEFNIFRSGSSAEMYSDPDPGLHQNRRKLGVLHGQPRPSLAGHGNRKQRPHPWPKRESPPATSSTVPLIGGFVGGTTATTHEPEPRVLRAPLSERTAGRYNAMCSYSTVVLCECIQLRPTKLLMQDVKKDSLLRPNVSAVPVAEKRETTALLSVRQMHGDRGTPSGGSVPPVHPLPSRKLLPQFGPSILCFHIPHTGRLPHSHRHTVTDV